MGRESSQYLAMEREIISPSSFILRRTLLLNLEIEGLVLQKSASGAGHFHGQQCYLVAQ